jgi:cell wall-associated NlpC family hydrolase
MAEARRVKAQVEALDTRVEIAAERYNVANSKHKTLVGQQKQAAKRVAKAEKRINQLQTHLNTRANDMYRAGPLGIMDVLLGARSFEQFASTWDILKDLNADDANSVAQVKVARVEAKAANAELTAKEKAAARQLAIMATNKKNITAQLAERQSKLAGVEREVETLQAQEEAARASAAASWSRKGSSGSGGDRSFPPPTRAPRSELISIARRYLGARYVWAGAGPNTFDCSGFTMFVYRQVGVSLPHSSRAQISCGERVSRKDLAPGDLVFFGSPIHHVGMYIGGGMMIHSPHSGDVVKISPISSDFSGACRP